MDVRVKTHVGVKRMFGLHLVKAGRIEPEYAKILAREQDEREVGDYEVVVEVEAATADARVAEAERFLARMEEFVRTSSSRSG
jgi:uncharacterized protein (UPF0332 family)